MIDYRAPVDAMLFALRHGAEANRLPAWDDATAHDVLREAARFIDAEIAPLDPVADATPARLDHGRVHVAQPFVRAYGRYRDAGWPGLCAPAQYGGQGLPHVLGAAVSEMLSGACVSFQMILSLAQGAMRTIAANGSSAQRDAYLPKLASGEWLATMCLTEPQAGSDLAQIRTTATRHVDGSYRIEGSKIFISGGDQDMTANIVHLVLARTPDAPPGTRGLSLFVCPAVLPDGSRNAVSCVRLEEKMGMHASPTCQLAFDGAHAELLGREGQGLAQMFVMMNAERLDVGMQGVGLAEVALQRAQHHAATRVQGRDAQGKGPVPIERHGDVQRMLATQFALTEGCRALLYRTAVELELGRAPDLIDFLTPLCKAFATDSAVEVAQLAIQIHGGYGYVREYRVEQLLRDARITPIYEGTNGIQAMTLAQRVLHAASGGAVRAFRAEAEAALVLASPRTARALQEAREHWEIATRVVLDDADPGVIATTYLRLCALVAIGAVWARLETHAEAAPQPERIRAGAAFCRDWLLPECALLARRIRAHHGATAAADAAT